MIGPETVIKAIRDKLEAKLPAKITALAYSSPAELKPFAYEIGDHNTYAKYPGLEVLWLPSNVIDEILTRMNVSYGVGVRVYMTDYDEESLMVNCMRLAKAVTLVLWEAREAVEFGFTLRFQGGQWSLSDATRGNEDMYTRNLLITFHAWVAEEMT